MKSRRHHNNKGYRQIKRDGPYKQIKRFARQFFKSKRPEAQK